MNVKLCLAWHGERNADASLCQVIMDPWDDGFHGEITHVRNTL